MRDKSWTPRMCVSLLFLAMCGHSAWAGAAQGAAGEAHRVWTVVGLFFLVLLMLLVKAAIIAFNLCAAEFQPTLFHRGRSILVVSPVKSFLVGLVNVSVLLIVGCVLAQHKLTALLGLLVLIALLVIAIVSRTLVYQLLGVKWTGEINAPEGSPSPRAHCLGGAAVELAFLVPIAGQLTEIVVTILTVGAIVLAAMSRERAVASSSQRPAP